LTLTVVENPHVHCAHLEILACSPVALQTTQVPWQLWDKLHYFLQMLKFSKDFFFKEHIFVKG
jgi:hypothetical protein